MEYVDSNAKGEGILCVSTIERFVFRKCIDGEYDYLRQLKNLKVLQFFQCNINDFAFLEEMSSLQVLTIVQDHVDDFDGLLNTMNKLNILRVRIVADNVPNKDYLCGPEINIDLKEGHIEVTKR